MLLDSTPELVEVAHYAEMIGRVLRQEGNADEKKRLLRGLVETLVVQPGRTIQPTLRVPRISDLGAKAQEGDGCVVRTQKPLVEVAGIEPASVSFSISLLRAQSTRNCRGWSDRGLSDQPVSHLSVPSDRREQSFGKSYLYGVQY